MLSNSCPHCDKKFTHRSTLKQHIRVHVGSRPYKCHVCTRSFVQNSNYRMHLLTHKAKVDRVQKCDLCGKELLSRRGVQKHRLRCVKKTVEKVGALKTKLTFKRGQYPCQKCSRVFIYHRRLLMHEDQKHASHSEQMLGSNESQNPEEGPGELQSVRNKLVHCPFCKRTFTYDKRLKDHLRKSHAGLDSRSASNTVNTTSTDARISTENSTVTSKVAVSLPSSVPSGVCPRNDEPAVTTIPGQSAGAQICVPSSVTLVYIPAQPVVATAASTSTSATVKYIPIVPKSVPDPPQRVYVSYVEEPHTGSPMDQASSDKASSRATECGPVAGAQTLSPLEQLYKALELKRNSVKERIVSGSRSLTALKRLSTQVGLEDSGTMHSEVPQEGVLSQNEEGPQKGEGPRSLRSEHLSALEQLSQKVGDDNGFRSARAVLDPSTQIPLRYPCLESLGQERDQQGNCESQVAVTCASYHD